MARTTMTTPTHSTLGSTNMAARGVNVILGGWLFISAFIWMHTASQFWNTWIVGALVVAFSLGAIRVPQLRFVNAALAVWLFISIWALPTMTSATSWNNALVAIGIFVVSLIGPQLTARTRRPVHA